ncbi:hypothetical protein Tco_0307756 [Tanacetum coccineum]
MPTPPVDTTTSSSHVQIPQPPPNATHSVQPPPQPSIVQPTAITPPTQPVQTTSPPPVSSIPDIQPTQPPSPQIPSPSFHDTEGPSFEPSYHMSPPPSHEPEIQASISSEENSGNSKSCPADKKVKKLRNKLKKKRKSKETNDSRGSGSRNFLLKQIRKSKTTKTPTKILHFEEPDSAQVNTAQVNTAQVNTAELNPDSTTFTSSRITCEIIAVKLILSKRKKLQERALATEYDYIQARLYAEQILAEKDSTRIKGANILLIKSKVSYMTQLLPKGSFCRTKENKESSNQKDNEKDADKEKKRRMKSAHEEFKWKKEQRKEVRRHKEKLKAKRRKHALVSQRR